MALLLGAFWASAGLLLYGYAGFPLLVAVAGRILDREVRKASITPGVSLLIAAYNEEESIGSRIDNALSCDYPSDALEIIVASDGSSDATEAIVSGYGSARVRLLSLPRRGKGHALNEAVRQSRGEILVFSDANSLFERDALRKLVQSFADPDVGGVAGHTGYTVREEGESVGRGEDLYWRYDSWIKILESRTGSVVAAHGGMYAIRRALFQPLKDAAVTDDFAISTGVVAAGRRLVFEPEARARELTVRRSRREFQRRVRLMTRGLRSVLLRRNLLDPRRHGFYSIVLFSHKVLRRGLVLLLPVLFLTSLALHARGPVYLGAAVAQGAFYSLAIGGWALRNRPSGQSKAFYVPFFFCMSNLASAAAMWNVMRGRRIEKWSPQRHERDDAATAKDHGSAPNRGRNRIPDDARHALERRGVRYCRLRRPERAVPISAHALPGTDGRNDRSFSTAPIPVIHLLVHQDDAEALEAAFEDEGFLRLPPAGSTFRSHLLGRSSAGAGLRVDVRTEIRYGPGGLRPRTPVSRMLGRIRRGRDEPVLGLEDETVDLLLHTILERDAISPDDVHRIQAWVRGLRKLPVQAGRVAERIQQELAPALTWDGLLRAVEANDWAALYGRKAALVRHLIRSEAARSPVAGGLAAIRSLFAPQHQALPPAPPPVGTGGRP